MTRHSLGWLGTLAVVASVCGNAPADDKEETQKRVKELLEVIKSQELGGKERRDAADWAERELVGLGEAAVPGLVAAAAESERSSRVDAAAHRTLTKVGKPAVPAIQAKWPDLNDEQRWRFIPLLEKHDPDSVREYARKSLDCKEEEIQIKAWHFVLRAKDEKVKERYFEVFDGKRVVPDRVRWALIPGYAPYFDEERENTILIALLDPDSWAAKGKGLEPQDGPGNAWSGDGRVVAVRLLRARKVADRKSFTNTAAPGLLKMLQQRGKGQGYLADLILPLLLEAEYATAVPELERIAESTAKNGRVDETHPYSTQSLTYDQIRNLAGEAAAKLKEKK
jgi:hypothetical protein